jgi:hypothetical protein
MNQFNRRHLLKAAAAGTAALGLSAAARSQVRSANDTIRVGVMGIRGRGGDHIQAFSGLPGVKVVAICDCDSKVLGAVSVQLKQKGQSVRAYADVRKMLADKDLDAVSTAAPNHWHSLAVVWACQAGKDVYVEKPVSHNVWEGRKAVEAARKHGRIVQTGTQSRSSRTGVDLGVTKATLGAVLRMDPKSECFLGNDQANGLLARNYRPPFVVPEEV